MLQVKSVFLQWLPWLLRMSRPGKKITRKTITMNSKMNELQLKEKACKSLLANVLDMDDDLRYKFYCVEIRLPFHLYQIL